MTDAAGNVWRYDYDVRGRQIRAEDPDSGVSTTVYDDRDRIVSTTDGRGVTLAYGYDALDRRTGVFEGSTSGTKLAEWTFDPATGLPASSTRFVNGEAYRSEVLGYDTAGRATGIAVTIPAVEGALAGTYKTAYGYNAADQFTSVRLPYKEGQQQLGGLPDETLTLGYGTHGLPATMTGLTNYVASTKYTDLGELEQYVLGVPGKQVRQTMTYDPTTRRIVRSLTERESATLPVVADVNYTYDPVGNVTRVADTPAGRPADVQCFTYDHMRRLAEAWTPGSGDCAQARSVAGLGGAAPYWQSFTYDSTGNRLSEAWHAAAGDTTKTYTYPAPGSPHPHGVTSVSDGQTFTYDAAGNTTARGAQTLSWNSEGKLASAGDTSFVNDADGNRLLRKDASGTTLYLGGGTELRLSNGTVSGTRYYRHQESTIAVRTASTLSWLVSDHHGTASVALTADTLEPTYRRSLPFGGSRGGDPVWPGERGFVGGAKDPTGLTQLGARHYDSGLGRFVSVDPAIDVTDPAQLHGYAYAENNPTSLTDADGLRTKKKTAKEKADDALEEFVKLQDALARAALTILQELEKAVRDLNNPAKQQDKYLDLLKKAAEALNTIFMALAAGLKKVNDALDKAGLAPIDYAVLEVTWLKEVSGRGLQSLKMGVSLSVDLMAVMQITGCGCDKKVKVTVRAVAKVRAQIVARFSPDKLTRGSFGFSFLGAVSRTGSAFFGISAVMGTMEGASASVRAGRLVVPTKSGSRAATGKEVDDFIAGWGWGVGVGAWNRQAAIARSVGSNVTAFEFGTPIYTLGSGAPLFSLLPKLPPDVGISFGYVWKLNLW